MRVLYVMAEGDTVSQKHIISFLKMKGVDVYTDVVKLHEARLGDAHWEMFTDTNFQDKHKKRSYDFIVFNTHSSFPAVRAFQEAVKPKIGFIDLEHDLFANDLPECSISYGTSLLITFQKRHYTLAKKHLNKNRKIVMARWPKLDMTYEPLNFNDADMWKDAVLIGTAKWHNYKSFSWPGSDLFNKIWYKRYIPEWTVGGVHHLPEQFIGPKGSKYCAEICKFIFTQASSCYQDALLFGSLPVVLPSDIVKEEPIDDILSTVTMKSWVPPGLAPFKAVTTTNFHKKYDLLYKNTTLYDEVRKALLSEWFPPNYLALPTAHEVMWEFIKENSYEV